MHRRLPSLNALRAFEAAARANNFSQAADELFVTHASISRHVRQLEEWLGCALFERHSRGVRLTEAGQIYATRLTDLFDQLLDATQEIIRSAGEQSLTVSVEVTFASRWLVPRLGSFQDLYPDIELTIEPDDKLTSFPAGGPDLAVRYGEQDWPEHDCRLLTEVSAFPVCSPGYLGNRQLATARDLLGERLLHEDSKQWWALWLEEIGVNDVGKLKGPRFQSAQMALEAAEADQGIALGDSIAAADSLEEGWLVRVLPLSRPAGAYYLVSRKGAALSAASKAFEEWLFKEMTAFLRASV